MSHQWSNTFVTGTGQTLRNVHDVEPDCHRLGCAIHNPTDPRDWPTHYDNETGMMLRLCPHGTPSMDRDDFAFRMRKGLPIRLTHCVECIPIRDVLV